VDQPFDLREQAERCRRLARDCTDPMLRDSLVTLAEEDTGRASVRENHETAVWQAGSGEDDQDADRPACSDWRRHQP
jgi:hypothetical protein